MATQDAHWVDDTSQLEKFITRISETQTPRINLDRVLLRLYYGRPLSVPALDVRRPSASLQDIETAKASGFSLVREVIDAAMALCVRLPAMKILPVGQQFKIQRGAKLMSRFLNGVFYDNNAKTLAPQLFLDAATTRIGALKWYFDEATNKMKCERLNSLWLLWDDAEGPEPKSLYYQAPASKRALISMFPEHESQIRDLPHWEPIGVPLVEFQRFHETDRVKVTEAWSLPSGKIPGKHVIQVGKNINLVDEKWKHPRFPVVPYRWSYGFRTWGGRPLAEILLPYQLWNNKITRIMAEASNAAVPKLMIHEKAELVNGFTDKIMERINWRGPVAPNVVVPTTIGVDLWRLREAIKAEAYEEGGVNSTIATGSATQGQLTSAPAQREKMDIASTRLIHPTEMGETFWKECGEVIVMLASDHGEKISAHAPMGSYLRDIPYKEINLAEGDYAVEVSSTAALPLTVGGRMDRVNDLLQMKDDTGQSLIKARDALRMLQIPDTESIMDRETASYDLANCQVEAALWEGNYIPPEPIQDLKILIDIAGKELMRALQNETFPEDNIELCRRLIEESKLLLNQAGQQQQAQTPVQPPMPAQPKAPENPGPQPLPQGNPNPAATVGSAPQPS